MSHYSKSQIEKLLKSSNHYQTLGISSSASHKQIREAFKDKALKYHPDKTSIPQAKQLFSKVASAYEELSDAQQKANYDEGLKRNKNAYYSAQSFNKGPTEFKHYQNFQNRQFRKPTFSQFKAEKEKYDKYFKPPPRPHMPKTSPSNQNSRENQQNQNSQRKSTYKPKPPQKRKNNCATVVLVMLFFFIFWSIVPNYSTQPKYQFGQIGGFSHKMKTSRYNVNYWMRPQDVNKTKISEERIQLNYIAILERQCHNNMKLKQKVERMKVDNPLNKDYWKKRQSVISYKACKKLLKLIKKYPLIQLTKFDNLR